jgi:N-acetyl-alpha-D-muramate 1-phosphate uridylyltransferase
LAEVNRKSLLQRNVEYLALYGIKDIIVNVHHYAEQIISAIKSNDGWGSNITISDETDEVLETGGGLKKASSLLNDSSPFILMNVDILTDLNIGSMLSYHHQHDPLATLAVTKRVTSRYFLFDNKDHLCGWMNENTGETKGLPGNKAAFSGIHIISPDIFSLMTETGKFSMVDVYLRLANQHNILAYDHSDTHLIDVGKPDSIEKAEKIFH